MKTTLLFAIALLTVQGVTSQTTHVVQAAGFSYDPVTLNINAGDSVKFDVTSSHPTLQVDQETWNANGITPLAGGFSFTSGSGTVEFPNAGTFYYVCTAHVASNQMKGRIIVAAVTAVKDVNGEDGFSLYPVPLQGDELTVQLKKTAEKQVSVEIYDAGGKLRMASKGELTGSVYKVNCRNLPAGVFVVKVKAGDSVYSAKVVRR